MSGAFSTTHDSKQKELEREVRELKTQREKNETALETHAMLETQMQDQIRSLQHDIQELQVSSAF